MQTANPPNLAHVQLLRKFVKGGVKARRMAGLEEVEELVRNEIRLIETLLVADIFCFAAQVQKTLKISVMECGHLLGAPWTSYFLGISELNPDYWNLKINQERLEELSVKRGVVFYAGFPFSPTMFDELSAAREGTWVPSSVLLNQNGTIADGRRMLPYSQTWIPPNVSVENAESFTWRHWRKAGAIRVDFRGYYVIGARKKFIELVNASQQERVTPYTIPLTDHNMIEFLKTIDPMSGFIEEAEMKGIKGHLIGSAMDLHDWRRRSGKQLNRPVPADYDSPTEMWKTQFTWQCWWLQMNYPQAHNKL